MTHFSWGWHKTEGIARTFCRRVTVFGHTVTLWSPGHITDEDVLAWTRRCIDGTFSPADRVVALTHPPGTKESEMLVLVPEYCNADEKE